MTHLVESGNADRNKSVTGSIIMTKGVGIISGHDFMGIWICVLGYSVL